MLPKTHGLLIPTGRRDSKRQRLLARTALRRQRVPQLRRLPRHQLVENQPVQYRVRTGRPSRATTRDPTAGILHPQLHFLPRVVDRRHRIQLRGLLEHVPRARVTQSTPAHGHTPLHATCGAASRSANARYNAIADANELLPRLPRRLHIARPEQPTPVRALPPEQLPHKPNLPRHQPERPSRPTSLSAAHSARSISTACRLPASHRTQTPAGFGASYVENNGSTLTTPAADHAGAPISATAFGRCRWPATPLIARRHHQL